MTDLRVSENTSTGFDGSLTRSPSLIVLHEPSSLLVPDHSKYAGIQDSTAFADYSAAILRKVQSLFLLRFSD
jgi:hypothetical protein